MKNILLGSSALFALSLVASTPISTANAACTTTTPTTGQTVTCTGTSTTPIAAGLGQNNVTVNIEDGARLNTTGTNSVALRNGSAINLQGSGQIKTATDGTAAIRILSGGSVVLNGTSKLTALGATVYGVNVYGNNTIVTLNDASSIVTTGNNAYGIALVGASNAITLNGQSSIVTNGNVIYGIAIVGANDTVTLNGQSSIVTIGDNSAGILVGLTGSNDTVTLNDQSSIVTSGIGSVGINSVSANQHIALNGGSVTTHGAYADGILSAGGNSTITLGGTSTITTTGDGSHGINVGGGYNVIKLLDPTTAITVTGTNANAILFSGAGNNNQVENHGTISSTTATAILGNDGGNDTVENFGIISSNGGVKPINLRAGNDTLTLGQGSQINGGDIDGGLGTDTLNLIQSGSEDNNFVNFEDLVVQGNGTDWSLSGDSSFTTIDIQQGKLHVNGVLTATAGTTVEDAGVLAGNGTLVSDVTSTGTIAPGNSVGTLTINGNLTQTGGAFEAQVGSSGVDRLNVLGAGGATLASGPALKVSLDGTSTGGSGIVLHADHGITGSFGAVSFDGNGAATLTQTADDITLIAVSGTPVASSAFAASEAGLDFLDSTGDEQTASLAHCGVDQCARMDDNHKHLWMNGFGHFGSEDASGGNSAFTYRIAGTAAGGDMAVMKDLRLGVSGGYSNTDETLSQNTGSADINTGQLSLYADWQHGPFFVTGQVSGGWQGLDLSRDTSSGEADASTHGWLFGTALQVGAELPFPHGWRLTPSAGVAYQHQWVTGYDEHGAGIADVSVGDHQADVLLLKAQLELANDIPWRDIIVTPHLKIGAQQQENFGGNVTGTFSTGELFSLALKSGGRTFGLIGLGVETSFENGLSTYVDYDGALATGRTVHAVTGGLRYSW